MITASLSSDVRQEPDSAGGAVGASPGRLADDPQLLRQVLSALPDMILILDRDLRVLFANRGMLGRPREQVEGVHVSNFLPERVETVALSAMRRCLATGEVDGYAADIEDAGGHTRHFGVRINPIKQDDAVVALALSAGDTTERVLAERAIATQSRMIDSMLEGVAVIDEHGLVQITNPAFDSMFGYERGELLRRSMRVLADWPLHVHEQVRVTDAPAGSAIVEFEGRRRDGTPFVAAGVLSGFDIAGRNHSLLVLQDVSERKQLERAILQAVNREQYRIGNDLHDGLGQELTGIALMLRGLAGRLTSEYPPLLPEIEGITRLVSNAIESTRSLARGLSPVNLERGGLKDALEGLAMNASELYGVATVFTHRLSGNRTLNPELANHLYRIAQEAVRNAVRHGQARSIRLHLATLRAKVRLSITDDGTGMPVDAMDAAGMGLKIMCYRARILGGDVSFEPVAPNGTRIVCECPHEPGGRVQMRKPARSR